MPVQEFAQIGVALSVNGFNLSRFVLRRRLDSPGEIDLMVEDPIAGFFSLDDRFELLLRLAGEDLWKVVDLAAAKLEIRSRLREKNPGTSAECACAVRVEEEKRRQQFRRAKEILYLAGIVSLEKEESPVETDWLESRVVLYVPRLLQARIRLRRAGFRQDLNSASRLQDPETGLWVELSERPCDRQG
jgi:hypothetical protein